MSWPTRQLVAARLDQLGLAAVAALAAWLAMTALSLELGIAGALPPMLIAVAAGVGFRRASRRAARGGIGRESEKITQRELDGLRPSGWENRHSVPWPRRGDIDHISIPPTGPVFVTDTKTSRYTPADVARAIEAAQVVARAWDRPAIGVICLARRHGVDRRASNGQVVVVSADRVRDAFLRQAGSGSTAHAIA